MTNNPWVRVKNKLTGAEYSAREPSKGFPPHLIPLPDKDALSSAGNPLPPKYRTVLAASPAQASEQEPFAKPEQVDPATARKPK